MYYYSQKNDLIFKYLDEDHPSTINPFHLNININGLCVKDLIKIEERDLVFYKLNSEKITYKDNNYIVHRFHNDEFPYTLFEKSE